MNRVIKFRAWNPNERRWLDREYVIDPEDGQLLTDGTELGYNELHGTECVLMQFTGLLDKTGKEIYEGDVVRIVADDAKSFANTPMANFPYGGTAEVYYDNVNAGFYLDNGDDSTSIGYYAGWSGWNWLEIIGNIYENPELLTKEKELGV